MFTGLPVYILFQRHATTLAESLWLIGQFELACQTFTVRCEYAVGAWSITGSQIGGIAGFTMSMARGIEGRGSRATHPVARTGRVRGRRDSEAVTHTVTEPYREEMWAIPHVEWTALVTQMWLTCCRRGSMNSCGEVCILTWQQHETIPGRSIWSSSHNNLNVLVVRDNPNIK